MSKRKDKFLEATCPYGFSESILANVYDEMIRLRCNYLQTQQAIEFEEGRVFYHLRFSRIEDKMPSLQGFHAILRNVPAIEHGVFSGIDTARLERLMKSTDWLQAIPHLTALYPKDVDKLVKIWQEMEQLKQCGSKQAADIVSQLQVKYWAGTLAERYTHLDMLTSRYDSSHYYESGKAHQGITAKQAYNLLSGRPVLREAGEVRGQAEDHWLQLKRITEPSTVKMFDEQRLPGFDIREKLEILPLKELLAEDRQQYIIGGLKNGNLAWGTVSHEEREVPVRISIDAEKQSAEITITDLQAIPIIMAFKAHNKERFSGNKNVIGKNQPPTPNKVRKNKGRSL